jgi:flagellar biosynthesis/type III secretory pathway M-ring protein FliF/YscJ
VFFAIRRKGRKKTDAVEMAAPHALPAGPGRADAASVVRTGGQSTALTTGNVESQIESQLAERDALQAQMDAQTLSSLKLAPVITKKAEVMAKHLREKIAKEPDISVQVLRTWIREEES